jgi:uncharacterized protein YneF (UPF0154 family)
MDYGLAMVLGIPLMVLVFAVAGMYLVTRSMTNQERRDLREMLAKQRRYECL